MLLLVSGVAVAGKVVGILVVHAQHQHGLEQSHVGHDIGRSLLTAPARRAVVGEQVVAIAGGVDLHQNLSRDHRVNSDRAVEDG